jgi:hypothetical protein
LASNLLNNGIIYLFFWIGTNLIPTIWKWQQFMKSYDKKYKILLYHSSIPLDAWPNGNLTLVNSPATCLDKATGNNYDLIAIFHEYRSLKERDSLVELCSMLKRNRHTLHIPLISLLPSRHRKLLELLLNTGVEYTRFYDATNPDWQNYIESLVAKPSEECKIGRILSGICPHINYFPIGQKNQEILYCGAYQNHLVLGLYRLRHLCETFNYKICEYFNCPINL